MQDDGLFESSLVSLPLHYRGKVRDIYAIDNSHWLIVATDRVSAFDVILPNTIPGKGRLLTEMALFWFRQVEHIIGNHLVDIPLKDILPNPSDRDQVEGRCMIVKRLEPVPFEAVVRGYLAGSGWKDYQRTGAISGVALPAGLLQSASLPSPIFTPATKAALGEHDENVSFEAMSASLGEELAGKIREKSLALYRCGADHARQCGLIIADTKFEFGRDEHGELVLMDEILTPDSSRFWEADRWTPGASPPSFDKQFVRDWLETQDWNKQAPGPSLPQSVIDGTLARYREALTRLTG